MLGGRSCVNDAPPTPPLLWRSIMQNRLRGRSQSEMPRDACSISREFTRRAESWTPTTVNERKIFFLERAGTTVIAWWKFDFLIFKKAKHFYNYGYLDFKRRVYLINIYKVINTIYRLNKLCRMDKNLHKYRQRIDEFSNVRSKRSTVRFVMRSMSTKMMTSQSHK